MDIIFLLQDKFKMIVTLKQETPYPNFEVSAKVHLKISFFWEIQLRHWIDVSR